MTAQMGDVFVYRGENFELAGISEGELFDPSILGLEPVGVCSACWRGYVAHFAVAHFRLVLDALDINLYDKGAGPREFKRLAGPAINGVSPIELSGKMKLFNNRYERLDYHLEYTGGLLLADGFIRELYVHMGFHPAWKYERVLELIFEGGVLKHEHDRSAAMADIRQRITESGQLERAKKALSPEEIAKFVERAFDRRYRM
jgi:hypothetical protein